MSWAQRKVSRPPSSNSPSIQMYNSTQHSNPEAYQTVPPQTWPHQSQQPVRQDPSQRQPYWQQPSMQNLNSSAIQQPPISSQYQQFPPPPPQQDQAAFFPPPTFNQQAYGNVQYSQQHDQNNTYANQHHNLQPSSTSNEWGGSWSWGDDDNNSNNTQSSVVAHQPQVSTNQTLVDSFANDESWNWSVLDSSQQTNQADEAISSGQEPNVNKLFLKIGDLKPKVEDRADINAIRKKLETPQWSTESQPSVESSDDVLQTSESDKSHIISRSSTISHSPISGQEVSPSEQPLVENKENVRYDTTENRPQKTNPSAALPKPVNAVPPLLLPVQGTTMNDSRNPYKRSSGLSHKFSYGAASSSSNESTRPPAAVPPSSNFNQIVNLETLPDNSEHPDPPATTPNVKLTTKGYSQWPQTENNEAPINDRNQYLETGQLSEANLAESHEATTFDLGNDTLPPPGLQRMIPGQMEQTESGNNRIIDPGFSRMVVGQNEITATTQSTSQFDLSGPPEGLRRMIPGESSSPETSLRQSNNVEENDSELELNQLSSNHGIQPPRSATIGADTPPIQSQAIQPLSVNVTASTSDKADSSQHLGLAGNDSKISRKSRSKEKLDQSDNRREAVEGQTTTGAGVSSLTSAVRNLTVGENLTDGHTSNTSIPEHSPRRHSRQESSESDSDRRNSRNIRDNKRSLEKSKSRDKERSSKGNKDQRDNERDRYRNKERNSPDPYRDRRDNRGRHYRDRRYEEDTDYYSDKDKKKHEDRDREYEKKYSSLRKEKEKKRKDRDYREPHRRGEYYYNRYGDDYGDTKISSRPSSRSDSMHESYRERRHEPDSRDRRPKDRERYRNRDSRDAYNPYQSYAYDPYNPYYQQYQYYENLRRTNPQVYAEWYRKYYQQSGGGGGGAVGTASFAGDDRASVHSGRSSANDEMAKDSINYSRTLDQTDTSLLLEEQPSSIAQRLTPAKFATAHLKASIRSGKMVKIPPHYPMDGQSAQVDLCNLQCFLENHPDFVELNSFPGPLIKGVTHKKQIIEYCESKIKDSAFNRDIIDGESYILMWELLILLIRQNGMVVGTDIAELLLKNHNFDVIARPASVLSTTSSNIGDNKAESSELNQFKSEHGSLQSILKEDEVTKKFREFLLYGSCQEALEWAMKNGLWGHALFLASKLEKRTYANVMMRFANGLTMNDPLQTLYQLLSGKMPAVVACVADEKWGDWRPHLAMILSNSTQRPELNCKAITQLGDTLLNRGSLYAAQFCYLMAQVGFGKHGDLNTKLVLLGSDHRKTFPQFATNEAIHMTEIYEYACSLNDQDFYISEFLIHKYLLATRLADFGLVQKSLQYLELLAGRIVYNPSVASAVLVDDVYSLADRLKFYDPIGDAEEETEFGAIPETNRPDNSWLKDLKAIQNDYQSGKLTQDSFANQEDLQTTLTEDKSLQQPSSAYNNQHQDLWQQEQQQYDQQQQQQFNNSKYQESSIWSSNEQIQPNQGFHIPEQQPQINPQNLYQQNDPNQTNYWNPQQNQPWGEQQQLTQFPQEPFQNLDHNHQAQQLEQQQIQNYYDNSNINQAEEQLQNVLQPQISMPNQPKSTISAFNDDESMPQEKSGTKPNTPQKVPKSPTKENPQSTGWFGGIFSKLSMKPKNQMKLPDDKNPKIVWDENKKKWTNVDEDPNDVVNEFKPPPKMPMMMMARPSASSGIETSYVHQNSSFGIPNVADNNSNSQFNTFNLSSSTSAAAASISGPISNEMPPPRPAQSNMFKMQKNRNVKNAYVDVFKQNGVKSHADSIPPAPEQVPIVASSQLNFFIPQPVVNSNAPLNFLTPGGVPAPIGDSQAN